MLGETMPSVMPLKEIACCGGGGGGEEEGERGVGWLFGGIDERGLGIGNMGLIRGNKTEFGPSLDQEGFRSFFSKQKRRGTYTNTLIFRVILKNYDKHGLKEQIL